MTILTPSRACFDLIKRFESCAKRRADGTFEAYPDPGTGGDPWTIGFGHTGQDVHRGVVITKERADELLRQDVTRFAEGVSKLVGQHPTTQNEFDALVSFSFNVGLSNLASSTLLKLHNVGSKADARLQFARWNKSAGRVMAGLTARRSAEAALYGGGA